MELTPFKASSRKQTGINLNSVRKAGGVPATYYGAGFEPVSVTVDAKELEKVFAPGKRYTLLDLVIDGKAGNPAIIHDYQKDPISGKILHLDFLRISENQPVKVRVQLKLEGLPSGVKNEGGVLSQNSRYINIACRPAQIPTVYTVDISDLKAGSTVYAKDLKLGDGITLAGAPRVVLYMISKAKNKEEVAAEDAKAAPAKAAAPAAKAAPAAAAKPAGDKAKK